MNHTINETINATINATTAVAPVADSAAAWLSLVFFPNLVDRVLALITAPGRHPQMIYIITPMLITLFLMEFYFGRYEQEELGWNTAVGNALVLIFVAVDLLKTTYPDTAPIPLLSQIFDNLVHFTANRGEVLSTLITIVIFCFGISLLFTNFFHWLPKRLAFAISGSLPINLISYLGIVMVYSNNAGENILPLDWYTLLAAFFMLLALLFLFGIVHFLEPKKYERQPKKEDENTVLVEE